MNHQCTGKKLNLLGIFVFIAVASWLSHAAAADLQLSWTDNSGDESGFAVERKTGTNGTYAPTATVGANVTTYLDTGLPAATNFCYRVRAFNSAGDSAFTPEACKTTPAVNSSTTTLVASPTNIPTGGTITAAWNGIGSPSSINWIGLYQPSAADTSHIDWIYVSCSKSSGNPLASGSCPLTVPASLAPGTYELRLFTNGYTALGRSNAFTVTPAATRPFDFSLAHSGNISVTHGQSVSNVITTTLISGSSESVSFSTSGLPTGTTASFPTSNSCSPTCSRTLDITTLSSTSTGTYPITVTAAGGGVTRTANFNLTVNAPSGSPNPTLSINLVKSLSNGGSGNGTVTSSPDGIDCGTDCSESYTQSTVVRITAVAAEGSTFAGWSGNADCSDGSVTMSASITCTATFNPLTFGVSVTKSGDGNGTVTSNISGVNCGNDCSEAYPSGTSVMLTAAAAEGSIFRGWSGGGCSGTKSCSLVVNDRMTVSAIFDVSSSDSTITKIGVYRPSIGYFFLDRNGNGVWEGCEVDICMKWLAQSNGIPVAGDWDGSGTIKLGTFDVGTAEWYLDRNGNGRWDGCEAEICLKFPSFGAPGDFPVIRANEPRKSIIGTFRAAGGMWFFDTNGTGVYNGCGVDTCYSKFGAEGNYAVVGDWEGNGKGEIGIFAPGTGSWRLDFNGNGVRNDCTIDKCYPRFGQAGDLPVAGDWDGSGKAKIGVFRPSTGVWYLDNGNGRWDGCGVDSCIGPFGMAEDRPVVGKWPAADFSESRQQAANTTKRQYGR